MAVVINGSGTVTGLSVGRLPDGTVDAGTLASNAVTEAKIASSAVVTAKLNDDAVTNAKMANDAITEHELAGNAVVTAAINDDAITAAKLASGVGGISDLTPYFTAYSGGNQVPSSGVTTKVTFAELDDSDSAYDGSNSKFTVPSGEGGRYFITTGGTFYSNSSNRVTDAVFKVYKNGSQVSGGLMPLGSQYASNPGANAVSSSFQMILTLAAGDYVEIYGYVTTNSGAVSFGARTFSGFKIGT